MRHSFLISFLVALFLCTPLCAQNIYLLSVGISDYWGDGNDLNLPENDARTVSYVYEQCGNATVETLLNSSASCENVKNRMTALFSKAGKNDIVVLFFSGHGSPSGFAAYDGVLEYGEIREIFSECKSVNKMVFADACFSGKLRVPGNSTPARGKQQNVMFFLSSRNDEMSIEAPMMKNGFFTAFLERGLRGGADNDRNRIITAKELFDFVSKGVKEISGDKQHPVMWGNFSNSMPVIKW